MIVEIEVTNKHQLMQFRTIMRRFEPHFNDNFITNIQTQLEAVDADTLPGEWINDEDRTERI